MLSTCLLFGGGVEAKKFIPPFPTAEFEQMDYAPLYPTYSWLTVPLTEFYMVQVIKVEASQHRIVRELFNTEAFNRVTD